MKVLKRHNYNDCSEATYAHRLSQSVSVIKRHKEINDIYYIRKIIVYLDLHM